MRNWFEKYVLRHTRTTQLHPLQKIAVGTLLVLLGISVLQNTLTPAMRLQSDRMLSAVLPSVIVDLTNKERATGHLGTLQRNSVLDEAARLKAEHMKKNDYFAHFSPEGISPWYWFEVAKYDYLYAGENLAVYFDESDDVVKAWMKSPLHKDNILKKEYTEIGVAVVEGKYDGYSTYFVVQLFGTPAKRVLSETKKTAPTKLADATLPSSVTPLETVKGSSVVQEEIPGKKVTEERGFEESTTTLETLSENTEPMKTQKDIVVENTIVERLQIEDTTIYVSDHASTSTVPLIGSTENISEATGFVVNTQTVLQLLFVFLTIFALSLIIASILFAKKQRNYLQAIYGIALLIVAFALTTFHAHIVLA